MAGRPSYPFTGNTHIQLYICPRLIYYRINKRMKRSIAYEAYEKVRGYFILFSAAAGRV